MRAKIVRTLAGICFLALLAWAQTIPPGVGQGWMGEFDHASRQLNALAEATPAEKFAWRPAPGIRSVSEVYMHIAVANYYLVSQTGVKLPPEIKITETTEKSVTAKPDVMKYLKGSQDLVRENYPKIEAKKKIKLFGADNTADNVFL